MSDKQIIKDNSQEQEVGNVTVSKEVVAIASGHRGKSPNILSRKDLDKGVEVWMKPGEATITIPIITDYEVGIFKVAEEVQRKVKDAVCYMNGLEVIKVNVNVQGIKFKEEKKKIKKEAQKEIQEETKK